MAYFHAMYLFPQVALNVYEEIVAVTGGYRMPTIADRSALRYAEAVWKESFRWNTFGPLVRKPGFGHRLSFIDHVSRAYLMSIRKTKC
jgi:hypothetical protein